MRIWCAPRDGMGGSAAVYALLDHAFRSVYGGILPEINKTANGKPFFPARPDVHFSLSHTKTHVLCAVSGSPVGCDIESPRMVSQRALRFFSSQEELALFDPLDLWVLKESYVKLFGQTFASIRNLRFSLDSSGKVIVPDASVTSALYHTGNCSAAVCCLGGIPSDLIELI